MRPVVRLPLLILLWTGSNPVYATPSQPSPDRVATFDSLLAAGRFSELTRLIRSARTAADRAVALAWLKRQAATTSGAYVNAVLAVEASRSPGDRADAARAMVTAMAEIMAGFPRCRDRTAPAKTFATATGSIKAFYLSELRRPQPERLALVDQAIETELRTADARRASDDAFVCGDGAGALGLGKRPGDAPPKAADLVDDEGWPDEQASVRAQLKGFLTSMMDPPVGPDGRRAGTASIRVPLPHP